MWGEPVSRGSAVLVVCAATMALATGTAITLRPGFAAALAATAAGAAALALASRLRIEIFYCCSLLLISGLVNLPHLVKVGPTTAIGLETGLVVAVGIAYFFLSDRRATVIPIALVCYVLYELVTLPLLHPTTAGAQNVLVALAFVCCLSLSQRIVLKDALAALTISRYFVRASWLALALFLAALLSGKAVIHNQDPNAAFSARSFAIFSVLILAWALSEIRFHRQARLMAVVAVVLITVSLSRSDLAAAAVMCSIAWLDPHRLSTLVKTLSLVALVFCSFYLAVTYYRPLHDRFYSGDVHSVAGYSINTEGRSTAWRIVWDRYQTSPIFGHGAGDSDIVVRAETHQDGHPHNDYLRILDDSGIVGFVLWISAYLTMIWKTRRAVDQSAAQPVRAAFLALIGIGVVMMFDNPLIYIQIMGPLGIIIGVALALQRAPTSPNALPTPAMHPGVTPTV